MHILTFLNRKYCSKVTIFAISKTLTFPWFRSRIQAILPATAPPCKSKHWLEYFRILQNWLTVHQNNSAAFGKNGQIYRFKYSNKMKPWYVNWLFYPFLCTCLLTWDKSEMKALGLRKNQDLLRGKTASHPPIAMTPWEFWWILYLQWFHRWWS